MDRASLLLVIALLLPGCGRQSGGLIVGSKNFTEQLVLGEIIAQHLEKRLGVRVERKLNLGGTLLAHEAVKSGGIDLYPEYCRLSDERCRGAIELLRREGLVPSRLQR